jgi:putative peptidoglycan lipid II flippase
VPLGVVLLPSMSRAMAAGSRREFGALVVRSLRLLLFVMLFLAAVGMVLRRQVVTLLFDYGRFDDRAIDLTANTLLFFLVGLAAHAMIAILARAFYAGQDTRTPVMAAVASVAVNVVVSLATVGSLGLSGLALGIAVGAWVETVILSTLLWRRSSGVALDSVVRGFAEFAFGVFLAAVAAVTVVRVTEDLVGVDPGKVATLVQATLATTVAAAVYVGYAWLLRVPELPGVLHLVRTALVRGRR